MIKNILCPVDRSPSSLQALGHAIAIARWQHARLNLLEVIEGLEKKGAHFKSLQDPIDTSTPQGLFSLQVLGAVAQLERSLISERTKAGLRAAKARGKVLGNPGVREHCPETIRRLTLAHALSWSSRKKMRSWRSAPSSVSIHSVAPRPPTKRSTWS